MASNFKILPNENTIISISRILLLLETGKKEIQIKRSSKLLGPKAVTIITRQKERAGVTNVNVIDYLISIIFKSNIGIHVVLGTRTSL